MSSYGIIHFTSDTYSLLYNHIQFHLRGGQIWDDLWDGKGSKVKAGCDLNVKELIIIIVMLKLIMMRIIFHDDDYCYFCNCYNYYCLYYYYCNYCIFFYFAWELSMLIMIRISRTPNGYGTVQIWKCIDCPDSFKYICHSFLVPLVLLQDWRQKSQALISALMWSMR